MRWPSLRVVLAGSSLAVFLLVVNVSVVTMHAMNAVLSDASVTLEGVQQQDHDMEYVWVDTSNLQTAALALLTHAQTNGVPDAQDVEHLASWVHLWLLRYGGTTLTPQERAAYQQLLQLDEQSLPAQQELIHSVATGSFQVALATWNELDPTLEQMSNVAHGLLQTTDATALTDMRQIDQKTVRAGHNLLLLALALIVVVATGAHLAVARIVLAPLRLLERAVRSLERGVLGARVAEPQPGEFGILATAFNDMASSLEASRAEERRLHEEALRLREDNLALGRRQLQAVVRAQEEERRRLARDLHDETAQSLTAVHFGLQRLAHHVGSPEVQEQAEDLAAAVRQTLTELHRLAADLRPSELDELGLVPALREWLAACAERSSVTVQFETDGDSFGLREWAETAVFRIVQEAVTNAYKHAEAQRVSVHLIRVGREIVVSISDDGRGFDAPAVLADPYRSGMGLHGMQERAATLGGRLVVSSVSGAGTRIELRIPLPPEDPREAGTLGEERTVP